ncbi:sensor histidine kinase [Paeniglutamicibacter cryotolerans]|uniref:histidine kinase n=1 Tax=Paeniglutamicibacter cryotolerans TaxID=670079 RepID=A0A839QPR6_9MICC|nr:HAMP domain-containing sensor histidine kinase [Paeniglutamicibacter cryotolerans]MBB2996754.1 signal transduction histidine kinase [Paeniglutamicibacter cryotolerans]
MKLRVLGVLSLLSLLLVALFSTVILESGSRALTQELQLNRITSLNRFAQLAYDASVDGDTSVLQREMDTYSGLYDEAVLIRLQRGTLGSGALEVGRTDVRDALSRASLNLSDTTLTRIQPFGRGTEVMARSFGSANQVLGEVLLEVNLEAARSILRQQGLSVGLVAAALAGLLLYAATRVTGWVLRPVQRLSAAVTELKETGRTGRLPEDGPPELRDLSRSFTTMAETVSNGIESQRRLIADTSHELRNPIGALRLRVDLLMLELQEDRERVAGTGVLAELERVEEILDGVLKLAVAEHRAFEDAAGRTVGAGPLIDPQLVLWEEVERARPAAGRAGTAILLGNVPEPGLLVPCSATELAQMVGELLNNAIKYAAGSDITAAIQLSNGRTAIEIADHGTGLPSEQRAAATTRFWRAPEHQGIRGTGMGLTIVERLAEANGARLALSENHPHGLLARIEFGQEASGAGEKR